MMAAFDTIDPVRRAGPAGGPPPPRTDRRPVPWLAAGIAALAVYVYAVGWLLELVRLAAARLPALGTAEQLSVGQLLSQGATSAALMLGVVIVLGGAAYLTSRRRWDVYGPDWHDIVTRGVATAAADPSTAGDRARRERRHARTIAGRAGAAKRWLRGHRVTAPAARSAARVQARALRQAAARPPGPPLPHQAAPLGDWAVRLIAGFNILIVSLLLGVGAARAVDVLIPAAPWAAVTGWLGIAVGAGVFLLARWLLTAVSPLRLPAWLHGLIWVVVGAAALFAAAPLGVLVLTGVAVSTAGRALARRPRPRTLAQWVRSPVLWALLAIVTLLGIADSAMPPVAFPRASAVTAAGSMTGGDVGRAGPNAVLVTCTALADATSTGERVTLVPVTAVHVGGGDAYVDSGARPSLARLAFGALGLAAHPPTLFDAALRARRATCAGAGPPALADGVADPALGTGVIAPAPAVPATARRSPLDEAPVQADGRTPRRIAALARADQPTLLVTAADRNWPVSVNSVLAERGPDGQPACLVRRGGARVCPAAAPDLTPAGATGADYLQLPVGLGADRSPDGQFQAFLRGADQMSGPRHQWLADPSRLDPWYTAQIYFYDAGPLALSDFPARPVDRRVPSGLMTFEYWFFYPFNYYPVVVDDGLMDPAPLAGDHANIDLHQGDWEHIDVLLDPRTMTPRWVYLARHDSEGRFVRWGSPGLPLAGGHPVVQAAFGGHPTYPPGCGARPRPITQNASSDWLACGSGRFAFPAASTPLVSIAAQPWACWPGHFGEATSLEVANAARHGIESAFDTVAHVVYVAGPRSPLQQAENRAAGACRPGP